MDQTKHSGYNIVLVQVQSWDFQAMEILYMWLYLASLLPIYKVNFMVCCATDILQDKQDVNLGARH